MRGNCLSATKRWRQSVRHPDMSARRCNKLTRAIRLLPRLLLLQDMIHQQGSDAQTHSTHSPSPQPSPSQRFYSPIEPHLPPKALHRQQRRKNNSSDTTRPTHSPTLHPTVHPTTFRPSPPTSSNKRSHRTTILRHPLPLPTPPAITPALARGPGSPRAKDRAPCHWAACAVTVAVAVAWRGLTGRTGRGVASQRMRTRGMFISARGMRPCLCICFASHCIT